MKKPKKTKEKTVLLIDGDIVAYQAATTCEKATEWENGYWTWHCDINEVKEKVRAKISEIMRTLKGDQYYIALSCDKHNFRKDILPTYKGNRAGLKKPLVLKAIREWMVEEFKAWVRPGLEGDDILGILATWDQLKGRKIIVSLDKDMKTIPGLFYRNAEEGLVEISEEEAVQYHMVQTLTGDSTDGYSGCPSVGPVNALKILDNPDKDNMPRTEGELWARVVAAYEKAGLSEEDALDQARVARILHAKDYNFEKKEPILWSPTSLTT